LTGDFFAPYYRRPHQRGSWQPKGLSEGFFHVSPNRTSFRHFVVSKAIALPSEARGEIFCEANTLHLNLTFPDWDEPTLLKTLQCMVFVGERSLQQQVLQAVPENGVALAPFETAVNAKH
jgi:hypothetical protein